MTHCNNQKDRPKSLHFQTSRATLSNVRSNEHGMSRPDLANCVNGLQFASLFYSSEYPTKDGDYHPVTEKLLSHAQGTYINISDTHILLIHCKAHDFGCLRTW